MGKVFSTVSGEGELSTGLLAKIAKVRKAVTNVEKDKRNDMGNYDYASEFSIKKAFQKAFDDEGLLFFMSGTGVDTLDVIAKAGPGKVTIGKFQWVISDLDGNAILGSMCGSGNGRDDKGCYAAITGAHKYTLMTNFNCTTGDDAEANKFDKDDREVPERINRSESRTPVTSIEDNPVVKKVKENFNATVKAVVEPEQPKKTEPVQTPEPVVEQPTAHPGDIQGVFGNVGAKDQLITADDARRMVGAFKKLGISEDDLVNKSGYKLKEWSVGMKAKALSVFNSINSKEMTKEEFLDA